MSWISNLTKKDLLQEFSLYNRIITGLERTRDGGSGEEYDRLVSIRTEIKEVLSSK